MKALFKVGFAILLGAAGAAYAQKWVTAAPVPQGAEEVYGIAAAGKMYVFGGLAPAWKPMGMAMEYDPATDRWTRKKDMPAYHHHVALAQTNGRIYMFGGYRGPDKGQATWIPVNNAWEYDPAKDSWRALPAMPTARGSANAVVVDGRIHVIGGAALPPGLGEGYVHPNRNVSIGAHEVFDPAAGTWSTRAPMINPRNHAAAGVIDNKIYIAGGRAGSVFIPNALNLDLVEEYDPANDRWAIRQPMPTPRSAGAWGVYNGRLYVAGGEIRHRDIWGTYTRCAHAEPRARDELPADSYGAAGRALSRRRPDVPHARALGAFLRGARGSGSGARHARARRAMTRLSLKLAQWTTRR